LKILLDHCVPKPFKYELPEHNVSTAREQGWEALKNGELIKQAQAGGFQLLITVDQNLRYQLNLQNSAIAVCVLVASGITVEELRPLVSKLKATLPIIEAGRVYEIST
jgi:UDP-N-acetylmuramyl tripeptide synthase